MKMKRNIFKLILLTTIISFSSCETLDLDQTENPSTLNQSFLDPIYTFNYVQLQLPVFVNSANAFTQRVTRQMAMTGGNTYDNSFEPVNFDRNWSQAYNMLNAIKLMEPRAIQDQRYFELGASKIIRCYVLMTLVDMYGDIPYTEALLGNDNITPKFDSGASVYAAILAELDQAMIVIKNPEDRLGDVRQDLYYDEDANKWVTLAKTLKLKMYITGRLAGSEFGVNDVAGAVTSILDGGDYIDTEAEDFGFRYGNSRFTPNTRHPLYNDQYEAGGGAYIANYYMWAMSSEKGFSPVYGNSLPSGTNDPRLHYYFYKQNPDPSDFNTNTFILPGRARPSHYNDPQYASEYVAGVLTPYVVSNWTNTSAAVPADGFWGRDHGDNAGIPQDNDKRTVGGIYPIGGQGFINPGTVQTGGTRGLLGAGIMPMLLTSWVHFLKAEAILELSVAGDARAEFLSGINTSIEKVTNFGKDQESYPTLTQNQQSNIAANKIAYPAFMLTKFDAATGDDRLEIVMKEYYLAAWGNGIETYNNYRRTGFPSNFQPTLQQASGAFYYRALYSASTVNNNPNTPANDRTRRVFWDKANITLH